MKIIIINFLLLNSIILAQNNIFDFNVDKRLFISYAFMNAAGNDAEWRKEGMDSIRIQVRKDLFAIIDSSFLKKIQSYVEGNHLESWTTFGPYALINSGPPEFNLQIDYQKSDLDTNFVNQVSGLRNYFIEFYNNYEIETLWEKYYPLIQKENQQFEPFANKALEDITNYCRMDNNFFSKKADKIYFQRIPLMLYFTAQTVKINGVIYIISGPMGGNPSEATFYHEALHHPIGELVRKYSKLIDKYSEVNSLNNADLGYEDWIGLFEECLVRSLEKILSAKLFGNSIEELNSRIYDEYKLGMVLCPYFNEELKKYEQTNISLDEYFPQLINNLDFNAEKERLNNFNKNSR